MNVFAKFGEIPSRTLQDIKETKRFGHTFFRTDGRMDGQRENIVCRGYKHVVVGTY